MANLAIVWNRRLHYYVGLYLLFFCWLFAFTGLLLNHPKWEFAQFWPNRVQTRAERAFSPLRGSDDTARARELMHQLGLDGEIQWPSTSSAAGNLTFQISRPGHIIELQADLQSGRATLQRSDVNAWGVMHMLHTFTGMRMNDARNQRDWWLTTLWALSMDAVAAGLVFMVASSYVMSYRRTSKRRGGIVALTLGTASCGLFVAGVRWLL